MNKDSMPIGNKWNLKPTMRNKSDKTYLLKTFFMTPAAGFFLHPLWILFLVPYSFISAETFFDHDYDFSIIIGSTLLTSILFAILPTIYLFRYNPLEQIDKFHPNGFMLNHFIMKYAFIFHSLALTLLILVRYFEYDEMLFSESYSYMIFLYLIYFYVMIMISAQFFISVMLKKKYLFALSKANLLKANKSDKELDQFKSAIECIKCYSSFLKKYLNVSITIKNEDILAKYADSSSRQKFFQQLLEKFEQGNDKNEYVLEPMKFLKIEFDENILQQTTRIDQLVKWTHIPVWIISIIGLVVTIVKG